METSARSSDPPGRTLSVRKRVVYINLVFEMWRFFSVGGVCYVVFEAMTMSDRVKSVSELAHDAVHVWGLAIAVQATAAFIVGGVSGFVRGFREGFLEERARQERTTPESQSKTD